MTCKDCYHYDVCKFWFAELYKDDMATKTPCPDFKDKSTILELPCKVGDTVFVVWGKEIISGRIVCIRPFVFENEIEFRGNAVYSYTDPFWKDGRIAEQEIFVVFGKNTFLTREEAEAALKAMEVAE